MLQFWIIDMILPITMICLGIYYYKLSDANISRISGFRTKESMKSKKNWKYAHELCSKLLIRFGILLVIYTVIIKIIEPISCEYLSLLNNSISLVLYIFIGVYVNGKIRKRV